ncbi:GvpL/GvpF family gas vesicle protein [Streptomyces sp. NPDC058045]|uniref:GvpL/GvpF family gas vesicle protein n=1 Tax=Streptomyces sp. NPDC058045 TaxID=3346311 RepID=UPI0036EB0176
MSTYVYGIVARAHPAPPAGLDGVGDPPKPLRLLTEGELAAVVSDAPPGLRPERRELVAHQHVLDALEAHGTVLPMPFSSLAPDDASVRGVLAQRAGHYLERLHALTGKVEYRVRARHDEEAVLRRVMVENPEIRTLTEAGALATAAGAEGSEGMDQRLRLGALVVGAIQAAEAEDAAEVRRVLEFVSEAVSVAPPGEQWLVDVACLVSREMADVLLTTVERLREDHPQLGVWVNGPLPPCSFVEPGPSAPAHR